MRSQTKLHCCFHQVYMWVGSQTSQVEIKLSLKACQVSVAVAPQCFSVPQCSTCVHILPLLRRCTSSTCAQKTQNTPGNCGWSERETSPTASHAASTPGGLSKLRLLKPTCTRIKMLAFLPPCCSLQIWRCLHPDPAYPQLPLPLKHEQNWPEFCCHSKVELSFWD